MVNYTKGSEYSVKIEWPLRISLKFYRPHSIIIIIIIEFSSVKNIFFSTTAQQPPSGPTHPHFGGFTITHNDAPQSVGLLWTSDRPDEETSI